MHKIRTLHSGALRAIFQDQDNFYSEKPLQQIPSTQLNHEQFQPAPKTSESLLRKGQIKRLQTVND